VGHDVFRGNDTGDHSLVATLLPRVMASLNPPLFPPSVRSNFHLGREDEGTRKARFTRAGFTGSYVSFHSSVVAEAVCIICLLCPSFWPSHPRQWILL
jgi:hypothetical protein